MDECIFCDYSERLIDENEHFIAFFDKFPVNTGHVLIVPKRHIETVFDLDGLEWLMLQNLIGAVKTYLDGVFKPTGYNVGMNCGKDAGQTICHAHVHIIPRYKDDIKDPRGGIRNFKEPIVPYPPRTIENQIGANLERLRDGMDTVNKMLECKHEHKYREYDGNILTSLPPKQKWTCVKCGHIGYDTLKTPDYSIKLDPPYSGGFVKTTFTGQVYNTDTEQLEYVENIPKCPDCEAIFDKDSHYICHDCKLREDK